MSQCSGCGNDEATVKRSSVDLCAECWETLKAELRTSRENHTPPRFLASYWTREYTLGYGLYISKTPNDALLEANRIAARNGWTLLRLNIQQTLTDVFVHDDYDKYFPHARKQTFYPRPSPYDLSGVRRWVAKMLGRTR